MKRYYIVKDEVGFVMKTFSTWREACDYKATFGHSGWIIC